MGGTIGGIIAAAAAIETTKVSMYQKEKLAKEDRERKKKSAAAAKAEADRIAGDTKPEEEALGETKFGVDDGTADGSTQDFLVPKTSALGGAKSGRSGLGFTI